MYNKYLLNSFYELQLVSFGKKAIQIEYHKSKLLEKLIEIQYDITQCD